MFVGTTGWLKTAFHREDDQRNGCIYVMNVQKWLHLLNAEPDQGSCKFHLHEFFEQFPREEEKERFSTDKYILKLCLHLFCHNNLWLTS